MTNIPSGGSGQVQGHGEPPPAGPAPASPLAPVTGKLGGQTVTKATQPLSERVADLFKRYFHQIGDPKAATGVISGTKLTGPLAQLVDAFAKAKSQNTDPAAKDQVEPSAALRALREELVRIRVESPSAKQQSRALLDALLKRATYHDVSMHTVFMKDVPKDASHLPRSEQFKRMHEPDLNKMLGLFMRGNEKEYAKLLRMVDGYHEFLDKMPVATDARNTAKMIGQLESALKEIEQQAGKIGKASWAAQVRISIAAEKLALQHFKAQFHLHDGRLSGLGQGMSLGRAMEQALRMGASDLTTVQIASPIKELGSGELNTVYTATFETFDHKRFEGVIKFDADLMPVRKKESSTSEAALMPLLYIPEQLGKHAPEVIGPATPPDPKNPQAKKIEPAAWARPKMGARVMATGVLDQLLGTNVVPRTHLAVINGTPATVMERAQGVSLDKKVPIELFTASELQTLREALAGWRKVVAHTNSGALEGFSDDPYRELGSFARKRLGDLRPFVDTLQTDEVICSKNSGKETLLIDKQGNVVQRVKDKETDLPDLLIAAVGSDEKKKLEAALGELVEARVRLQDAIEVGMNKLVSEQERQKIRLSFFNGLAALSNVDDAMPPDRFKITAQGVVYFAPRPPEIDYADPGLMKEMMKLQALDFLTGEMDHHSGNYLIYKDEQSDYSVKAFDNDLSWNAEKAKPEDSHLKYVLPNAPVWGTVTRNLGLPPALDDVTAEAILQMAKEPESARIRLGLHLSPQQIEAFEERLQLFAEAIARSEVKRMHENDWKNKTHEGVKAVLGEVSRSYVARDKSTLDGYRTQGIPTSPVPWG